MGAAPDRRINSPNGVSSTERFDQQSQKPMDGIGPSGLSLVTGAQKSRSWKKSLFNLDVGFQGLMLLAALVVLAIVALIVTELLQRSSLAWHKFGLHFFFASDWNPVSGEFGALPFVFGTIVSSLIALAIAVPLAVAVAVFVTEMCPKPLRKPISFATELLAAIPSVIYGLWAIFVLVPILRVHLDPWLMKYLSWTGLFAGPPYGIGMLAAGIILAIMIVPIISAITREVLSVVPQHQREGVLALGATRWEIRRPDGLDGDAWNSEGPCPVNT